MKGVTIDNLDPAIHHQRYARDVAELDSKYILEASNISANFEVEATSSIYSSKLEELFEIQLRNLPWAFFAPPPKYREMRRRLFTHKLFPHALFGEEESEEDADSEDNSLIDKLQNTIQHMQKISEKEKHAIFNMIEMVQILNRLLEHIYLRKLQYHKG